MLFRICFALILFLPAWGGFAASEVSTGDQAGFVLHVRNVDIPYREFAVFALPDEAVPVSVPENGGRFQLKAAAGTWRDSGANHWTWTAPAQPGHYALDIVRADGAAMRLEAFVMVPAGEVHDGRLHGYRIGRYPRHALNNLAIYRAPAGFVEVTPETAALHVTPHFTLGEFVCKQAGGYPKYLVLRDELLLKLETVMAYLNGRGVPPDAVHVMSGYRTPWYNQQLGNVPYSRHQWGDAADIYVDEVATSELRAAHGGGDGYADSRFLAGDLDRLFRQDGLRGGVGVYPATHAHAPFVHVDARGFAAHW